MPSIRLQNALLFYKELSGYLKSLQKSKDRKGIECEESVHYPSLAGSNVHVSSICGHYAVNYSGFLNVQ